ncbi:MAG: hypothetical protein U9R60_12530 [Bacteroidota bacterium]|nr:hypothetical protein [Bacteroidota bacterium]
MKWLICLMVVLSCFVSETFAQSNSFGKRQNISQNETGFYIGMNPLAIPAVFQLTDDVKRFIPVFTGVEYGLAVCGGYFLNSQQAMETLLSLGNVHQVAFVGQLHLGTNYPESIFSMLPPI